MKPIVTCEHIFLLKGCRSPRAFTLRGYKACSLERIKTALIADFIPVEATSPRQEYPSIVRFSRDRFFDDLSKDNCPYYLAEYDVRFLQRSFNEEFVLPPPIVGRSVLFVGRDSFTPFHFHEHEHAVVKQLFGTKTFRLTCPQSSHLFRRHPWYSTRRNFSSIERRHQVALRDPTIKEIVLNAGDCLYIPVDWWHSAQGHGVSATVTTFWNARLSERKLAAVLRELVSSWSERILWSLAMTAVRMQVHGNLFQWAERVGIVESSAQIEQDVLNSLDHP